jgi:hypothetical protein
MSTLTTAVKKKKALRDLSSRALVLAFLEKSFSSTDAR